MDASGRWLRWLPIPVAVVLALAGWVVLRSTLGAASNGRAHAGTYEAGGVVLTVNQTKRLPHDMDGGQPGSPASEDGGLGNFQMPQSMMPGMQAADEDRVQVEVSLRNSTDSPRRYDHGDFRLVSRSGGRWNLKEGSFTPGSLAPGFSVILNLYFDIPLNKDDLFMEWSAGRRPVDIPLVVGDAPAHGHQP